MDSIPNEILLMILHYLNFCDKSLLAITCKFWFDILEEELNEVAIVMAENGDCSIDEPQTTFGELDEELEDYFLDDPRLFEDERLEKLIRVRNNSFSYIFPTQSNIGELVGLSKYKDYTGEID